MEFIEIFSFFSSIFVKLVFLIFFLEAKEALDLHINCVYIKIYEILSVYIVAQISKCF